MNTAEFPKTERMMPKSNRALILRSLVPLASNLSSEHLQAFLSHLSDALRQHANQNQRPAEALLSADVLSFLKKNSLQFYANAPGYLTHLLIEEIDAAGQKQKKKNEQDAGVSHSVSFDDTERKNAIRRLGEAIELENEELVTQLNKRIAYLLQARSMSGARNPFRPETFIQALLDAWGDFYEVAESQGMVLRLLRAEMFPHIRSVMEALNQALIARGILVDPVAPSEPENEPKYAPGSSSDPDIQQPLLRHKLRQLLPDEESSIGDLLIPNLFPDKEAGADADSGGVHGIATALQTEYYLAASDETLSAPADVQILRLFKQQMRPGMLTQNQENSVDLLIGIYEYIFADDSIEPEIKNLIAPLQVSTLKAALLNKDFFFKETHPARQLVEKLLKASIFWNPEFGTQDPLYQAIKNSVDQVKYEEEPSSDLFAAVVVDFESFVAEEAGWSEIALTEPIAEALRQEKIRASHDVAEREVSSRIDSGEVAGFVEKFLEDYWVPVLALAHSVKEDKPEAFEGALKAMDGLIWSMKPKANPEERKVLIGKLPPLLSLVNVWLNTIKCDDKDRTEFFSKLAERHASIVRADQTLRGQIEFAVNVAEKVSERRLKNSDNLRRERRGDKFTVLVSTLALGDCVEFPDDNDVPKKFKLAWMNAKRSILLFANHQGRDAFSIGAEDLAQNLRIESARVLVWVPMVERALVVVFHQREANADKTQTMFVS